MTDLSKYRVTSDRLLVEVYKESRETRGGLIIADASEQPTITQATVVATGPGRKNRNGDLIAMGVSTGDRVIYTAGVGIPVKFDGHSLVILSEDDVLGVISDWVDTVN